MHYSKANYSRKILEEYQPGLLDMIKCFLVLSTEVKVV